MSERGLGAVPLANYFHNSTFVSGALAPSLLERCGALTRAGRCRRLNRATRSAYYEEFPTRTPGSASPRRGARGSSPLQIRSTGADRLRLPPTPFISTARDRYFPVPCASASMPRSPQRPAAPRDHRHPRTNTCSTASVNFVPSPAYETAPSPPTCARYLIVREVFGSSSLRASRRRLQGPYRVQPRSSSTAAPCRARHALVFPERRPRDLTARSGTSSRSARFAPLLRRSGPAESPPTRLRRLLKRECVPPISATGRRLRRHVTRRQRRGGERSQARDRFGRPRSLRALRRATFRGCSANRMFPPTTMARACQGPMATTWPALGGPCPGFP